MTQIVSNRFFTLWHVDPERGPGGDDSCGWFKRYHHGHPEVIQKITKRFEEDWDRTWSTKKEDHDDDDGEFKPTTYFCGYFCPNGDPHMTVQGIVLNLFFLAINAHFACDGHSNWKRSRRWMQRNLFDILLFAENPTDSLHDAITRKFHRAVETPHERKERIETIASIIYGWILRREQRWWQHPRWHIHHWKIQFPLIQKLKRCWFERCSVCGKGFKYGEVPIGNWDGDTIWHQSCDRTPDPIKEP